MLATGRANEQRTRVAVTPKLPAVPVDADNCTLFTARINFPESTAGIKPFNGCIKEALRVAASEIPVKLPLVPSLYVTLTVAGATSTGTLRGGGKIAHG
jgi:hypothetical protein